MSYRGCEEYTGRSTRPMLARGPIASLAFGFASLAPRHGQDQAATINTPAPIVTDRPCRQCPGGERILWYQ